MNSIILFALVQETKRSNFGIVRCHVFRTKCHRCSTFIVHVSIVIDYYYWFRVIICSFRKTMLIISFPVFLFLFAFIHLHNTIRYGASKKMNLIQITNTMNKQLTIAIRRFERQLLMNFSQRCLISF